MQPQNNPDSLASPEESSTSDPSQKPPYWFQDGDVILQVEPNERFRVHKAYLRSHSTVFQDLFASGENMGEGLQVVPMQGDSAHEVRGLLRVIYEG